MIHFIFIINIFQKYATTPGYIHRNTFLIGFRDAFPIYLSRVSRNEREHSHIEQIQREEIFTDSLRLKQITRVEEIFTDSIKLRKLREQKKYSPIH